MAYTVRVKSFEGPLDLLLHLIQRAEMDIHDIEIAKITDDYLAYLAQMQEEKLELASEFLVMAATLLSIKSRSLLPRREDPVEAALKLWEEELDPRSELIRRLVEYRRFKAAAHMLREREQGGQALYGRPPTDLTHYRKTVDLPLDVSILALYISYQTVLQKAETAAHVAVIVRDAVTVEEAKRELLMRLESTGRPLRFFALVAVRNGIGTDPGARQGADGLWRERLVILFLAVLELVRERQIDVVQARPFDDLILMAGKRG
ncbi:MAG: segregation/condensation protein A [Hydrogenibacillus sp.]|nr:segregation/condensation protein A [Hydrogenibacillus sp.]